MNRSTSHTTRLSGIATVAALGVSPAAFAQQVDFEDVAVPSGAVALASPAIESDGYRFSASGFMNLQNDRLSGMGANGTTTLWGKLIPVRMTSVDGEPFDLVSAEFGEMNSMFSAKSIRITGVYADGGSITQDVILDQLYDGPGGMDDLQSYTFGSSWTGLKEVQFAGVNPVLGPFFTDFVLDNIELGGGVADSDGDGVPDDEDACPNSDMRATVHVGGRDSGVSNMLFEDGCTMADMVAAAMDGAKNHGQAVSAVSHLANDWKKQGLISGREKGAISSAAAKK